MFWLFVLTISVVGTVLPYLKHRETQRTIRTAIEKGQPIDPALLTEAAPKREENKPEALLLFGLVLIAAGLGLQLMSMFIGWAGNGEPIWPINGAGAIAIFIGIALFSFGRWQLKRRS